MTTARVPPHNLEAEAAVLSASICDQRALDIALPLLDVVDFYSDAHQRVWSTIRTLREGGTPIDIQTIANRLKDQDRLQAVGGFSFLSKLIDATPAIAHVGAHADIVKAKARVRRLADTCALISAECYGNYGDTESFLDSAEQRVFNVAQLARDEETSSLLDLVLTEEARLKAIENGALLAGGVPFGFTKLDEKTGGMREGECTVIAGRPGMGKTALAMNIAVNVGRSNFNGIEQGVLIQSIEMKRDQLTRRMAAAEAWVNSQRVLNGKMSPSERERIHNAFNRLSRLPVVVDDTSVVSPMKLRARLRRAQARFNVEGQRRISLVIIDYIQRMKPDVRGSSREQDVAQVMTAIAETAKEAGVHVIAVAQLNRSAEQRGTKERPRLSDLRESGQIEQDAHNIFFVHRPEYYYPDKETVPEDLRGAAEIVIGKQRDGETGIVPLEFAEYCTRFSDPRLAA